MVWKALFVLLLGIGALLGALLSSREKRARATGLAGLVAGLPDPWGRFVLGAVAVGLIALGITGLLTG